MNDKNKTQPQLISELAKSKQPIAELEKSETERRKLTVILRRICDDG